MRSFRFYSTDFLPEEHQRDTDYLVAWNDHRIAVGDKLKFIELDSEAVTVTELWLVIGQKILEGEVMENGHNYIVRFNRSIGRVELDTPYHFEK